jgi:hypothetical protein
MTGIDLNRDFSRGSASFSDDLSRQDIELAKVLVDFLNDSDLKQALTTYADYKQYRATIWQKDVSKEAYLASIGIEQPWESLDHLKKRALRADYDPRVPEAIEIEPLFTNLNFDFEPEYLKYDETYEGPAKALASVRLTFDDMANHPDEAKQKLIQMSQFWDKQLKDYLGDV